MLELPITLFTAMFFSGWLSLLFSIVFVLALIVFVSDTDFSLGYVTFVLYAVALQLFTDVDPLSWVWYHPIDAIAFVLSYFIVGGVYSVIKYRSWIKEFSLQLRELKHRYIEIHGLQIQLTDEIPESEMNQWRSFLYSNLSTFDFDMVTAGFGPGIQKELILNWIVFWPFSAVGLLIANPLKRFVNFLYEELVSVYRNMYKRMIAKYINIQDIERINKSSH